MYATTLSREDFFYQLSLRCCLDGKISGEEIKLLQNVAKLLGIDPAKASELANSAISEYRSGNIKHAKIVDADSLYQFLLLECLSDGVLEAKEDEILQELKKAIGADSGKFKEIDPQRSDEKGIRLKPLECINCKGLLPLEMKEWLLCPYCGNKNSIPITYVDAMLARKAMKKKKSAIDELRDSLGRVPTAREVFISLFSDFLLFFCFALVAMIANHLLNILLFGPLIKMYETVATRNFHDFFPPSTLAALKACFLYVLFAVPFAWIYRIKRKINVLGPLQMSLAAGPPVFPGGPATCKNCGACLSVQADSHLVSCNYCETDNLVGLPERYLRGAKSTLRAANTGFSQALARLKKESRILQETLLGLAVLFVLLGFLLNYSYQQLNERRFLPYLNSGKEVRSSIFLELGKPPTLLFDEWNLVQTKHAWQARESVNVYFAMQAGEKIQMEWKTEPVHYRAKQEKAAYLQEMGMVTELKSQLCLTSAAASDGGSFDKLLQKQTVKHYAPFVFSAGLTGYYHLKLFFPREQTQFYIKLSRL